jgi:hypothetical protein
MLARPSAVISADSVQSAPAHEPMSVMKGIRQFVD